MTIIGFAHQPDFSADPLFCCGCAQQKHPTNLAVLKRWWLFTWDFPLFYMMSHVYHKPHPSTIEQTRQNTLLNSK